LLAKIVSSALLADRGAGFVQAARVAQDHDPPNIFTVEISSAES
jgi:hypothetical protein